jgi:hypothetical protein
MKTHHLVYILTLNPVTHKIERGEWPVGWTGKSRIRDAKIEARKVYKLKNNQAPYLEPILGALIKRIVRRQTTAVKRGRDASFVSCYRAMLAAPGKRERERERERDSRRVRRRSSDVEQRA